MFSMGYDVAFGLAAFLFSGKTNSDADYQAYIEAIEMLKEWHEDWAKGAIGVVCGLLVVDAGNPVPDAKWRRRIADASADIKPPALFGLVSESRLVRGTVTAINWIRPPAYTIGIHSTFEDAVAWAERERGTKLPLFHDLLKEARSRADRGEHYAPRVRRGSP